MKRFFNDLAGIIKCRRFRTAVRLVFGGLLLIVGVSLIVISTSFSFDKWRDLDPKLITGAPQALVIKDNEGAEIAFLGGEKRIPVSLSSLQKYTADAFVSAEDARFYKHKGIDIYRVFGAAWADIKAGSYVQGASTISQQLIKLSHLSSEKTLDRKLEEAALAVELERVFDKNEILEMYLNYIYFGGGYYGIEAASLGYFGVHSSELTLAQSAQLAGILKSPAAYAPHIDPEASISRRNNVLSLMLKYGYIGREEYEAALEEDCVLVNALSGERNALIDTAINEAAGLLGTTDGELLSSGFTLELALDSDIMRACREIMKDDTLFPSESAQAAIAVVDSAGGICAMIGGRGEYTPGGLNRAAEIERQPGSLIKPILVYAPALELSGYSAADVLDDEPMSFGDYSPRNSDERYYGKVTLRTAVTKSLNIPAVEVFEDIGISRAVDFARSLGVSFENESVGLPLALGGFTHGVSPVEMAGAYSAFARGGLYTETYAVKRIIDRNGNVLYQRNTTGKRVMTEENAFILTTMLQSVAEEGTGKRLGGTGLRLAAKTGTSVDGNGVRDAWCAAYSKEYTAVVWMGTDSSKDGSLPSSAVGGNNTAVILGKLFESIYCERSCPDFAQPENVIKVSIDMSSAKDGYVYTAGEYAPEECIRSEYFVKGTEPKTENPYWKRPPAPDETGWYIENGYPVISFTADSEDYIYIILRSEAGGPEKTVFESSGNKGYVCFTDRGTERGGSYTYRIIAVHPELKEKDGSPMMSEPSRKMRVVVPFIY